MFHKMRHIFRAEGVSGLTRRSIAFVYRRGLRPSICQDRKWGDRFVPITWVGDRPIPDEPGYEAALVAALNETVRSTDNVVIIGAGLGVTAVIAALRAGPLGTVQCFEASKQCVKFVQETAARNKVSNVSVHHVVVSKPIFVYGNGIDLGAIMPSSQLPQCDVLELDCEGAEAEILRDLTIHPRVIVVETHGVYGAPTDLVASLLEKRGYVVSDRGVADPRYAEHHAIRDVRVLLGTIR
jgi:hypothetical protein